MKLSDQRIRKLSKAMAKQMIQRGAVKTSFPDNIASAISRVMTIDQKLNEELEQEARATLSRQRNLPPPGTGEYNAAFQQAKRAAAMKRGIKY